MVVPIPPDENLVRGDFDQTPVGAFVVAEIPFVFVIKMFGQFVGGLAVGGVGVGIGPVPGAP